MTGTYVPQAPTSLAVFYLARGADSDHLNRFRRFVRSYRKVAAGTQHTLFVIFKGFTDDQHLREGREVFAGLDYDPLFTADDAFDIGAYAEAATQVSHDRICCLNTNSEIIGEGWLGKLAINLDQPRVGMVGATGSFESLRPLDPRFPDFPNVHVRSNAIMMRRELLLPVLSEFRIREKVDAYFAESGPASITRRVFERGLGVAVVGRDGRGYPPQWWPASQTFRLGTQGNLLVSDNETRNFERLPWSTKQERSLRAWGRYLQHDIALLSPGWLGDGASA